MRHTLASLAVGAVLLAAAPSAIAQQNPASDTVGLQESQFRQQGTPPGYTAPQETAPLFHLFGVPVVINTPVIAPYCNCAGQTYAGAPVGGTRNTPLISQLAQGSASPAQ